MALDGTQRLPQYKVIKWDKVIFDPGRCYDKTYGNYTAPFDGIYQFSATIMVEDDFASFWFQVKGMRGVLCTSISDDGDRSHTSCTATFKLRAGDQVSVENDSSENIRGQWTLHGHLFTSSYFTGSILSLL